MRLAIDFDETIHINKEEYRGKVIGKPLYQAKEILNYIIDRGHYIVIFTLREQSDFEGIRKWMRENIKDIQWDVTNKKPFVDYYIDDRAIAFKSWFNIMAELKEKL